MNAAELPTVLSPVARPYVARPRVAVVPAETETAVRPSAVRMETAKVGRGGWWAVYGIPALVAVAAHAALALSGGKPVARPVVVAGPAETAFTVDVKMENEPEEVVIAEENASAEASSAVSVLDSFAPPQLVDAPTITFNAYFVQPLQMPKAQVNTAGLLTIPKANPSGESVGARMARVFSVAAVDRQPELMMRVQPNYPKELLRDGVKGEVVVTFVVARDGEVRDVEVASSSHSGFERAAVEAVRKWRFRAGEVQGQPVATRMELPIGFSLPK